MTRWMLCTATLLLFVLFLPARALAQPTSYNTAVPSAHIGMVHSVVINDTDQQKWFRFFARVAG